MTKSVTSKYDLDTPCLVLDLDILEYNLEKMHHAVVGAGKHLRPHAKTHKCSVLAKKQIKMGAIGVCAAKVSEAEVLVKAGLEGVLVTGPVATEQKIKKLIDVLCISPSLMTVVDHLGAATLLNNTLHDTGLEMDVLIDVDVGLHRTGVKPENAPILADHILSCEKLHLRGIQAYAGQVQHIPSYEARKTASLDCLQGAARIFRKLQTKSQTCTIFSASGTGTFDIDLAIPEITELQAGSYACMDVEYLGIGSAADEKQYAVFGPALRLLTTIVSANQKGFVTVDAGLKSLYKDGGTPRLLSPLHNGMLYGWFGDEYGFVTCPDSELLPIGAVLELVVSHCDPTINLFDRFHLVKDEDVVDTWPIDLRGCCQ